MGKFESVTKIVPMSGSIWSAYWSEDTGPECADIFGRLTVTAADTELTSSEQVTCTCG